MSDDQYSDAEKLEEIERELAIRERLYPGWIQVGKLSAAKAQKQIDILRAIKREYEQRSRLL